MVNADGNEIEMKSFAFRLLSSILMVLLSFNVMVEPIKVFSKYESTVIPTILLELKGVEDKNSIQGSLNDKVLIFKFVADRVCDKHLFTLQAPLLHEYDLQSVLEEQGKPISLQI